MVIIMARNVRKTVRFYKKELQEIGKLKHYMRLESISDILREAPLQMLRIYRDDDVKELMQETNVRNVEQLIKYLIRERNGQKNRNEN